LVGALRAALSVSTVVDRFLVPGTPEPHISCNLRGVAEFRERDVGGAWITRQIHGDDMFVTRSRTPYEVDFQSPPGEELDNLSIHMAVDPAALEARYPGRADRVEVVDYFDRDEILWPICLTCVELLAARAGQIAPCRGADPTFRRAPRQEIHEHGWADAGLSRRAAHSPTPQS
jgi:hypothetical protein